MLSTFGVLTHPLAHPVPVVTGAAMFGRVYVDYVGVAQRRFGSSFEVIPVADFGPARSPRCLALEASAERTDIARAPAQIRAKALRIADQQIQDERSRQGICVFQSNGAGTCQSFRAAALGGAFETAGAANRRGATFVELVPNGVAKVTVRLSGSGTTISVPVINNLAVWRMAAQSPVGAGTTFEWRAADGHIVRTVHLG